MNCEELCYRLVSFAFNHTEVEDFDKVISTRQIFTGVRFYNRMLDHCKEPLFGHK